MDFSKVLSGITFFGALAIGIFAGYIASGPQEIISEVSHVPPIFEPVPVDAKDMVGVWKGTWGYNRAACTLTIERVDGDKFYGKLNKGKAEIAFAGSIDSDSRTISFSETKVLRPGEYAPWSLGQNTGSFSLDGRSLSGTGTDKHGMYFWDASKE